LILFDVERDGSVLAADERERALRADLVDHERVIRIPSVEQQAHTGVVAGRQLFFGEQSQRVVAEAVREIQWLAPPELESFRGAVAPAKLDAQQRNHDLLQRRIRRRLGHEIHRNATVVLATRKEQTRRNADARPTEAPLAVFLRLPSAEWFEVHHPNARSVRSVAARVDSLNLGAF